MMVASPVPQPGLQPSNVPVNGAVPPATGAQQAPVGAPPQPPQIETPMATPPVGNGGAAAGQVLAPSEMAAVPTEAQTPTAEPATPVVAAKNEWTMIGYDLASTFHNPAETKLTKENAASLEVAWTADMGTNIYGAPLQVDGKLYISVAATTPGLERTTAFDAASGMELWSTSAAGTTASMAYDDGRLYLHTVTGKLTVLDAATGTEVYSVPSGPSTTDGSASPIVYGDKVFLGGANMEFYSGNMFRGFLHTLNKADGSSDMLVYTVPENGTGVSIWATPSLDPASGLVVAATGNNHGPPATDTSDAILGFDMSSLEMRWKNQVLSGDTWSLTTPNAPDADFAANPILVEAEIDGVMTPMIAAGQKSGDIYGLKRDDGTLIWERNLCPQMNEYGTTGVFLNTSWSGSSVLVACNHTPSATLYGIAPATGEILWMTALSGVVMGRISSANGVGFVGAGAEMVVFDSDSGEILKTFPAQNGTATVAGTPSIVDGRVAYGEGMGWIGTKPGTALTVLALP